MMANDKNLDADRVEDQATHSLDDSENSRPLHDDLFLDSELDGIFEGDEEAALAEFNTGMLVVEEAEQAREAAASGGEGLQEGSSSSNSNNNNNIQNRKPNQQSSSSANDGIPSTVTTTTSSTTRREGATIKRRSSKLEGENRGLPPPGWHSDAADRQHRQEMILEIARLLQARKTVVPSEAWLRELPHKARKLEARLYRFAPSLEAYLDRKTLKLRLKKVARAIVRQHTESKRLSFHSGRYSLAQSSISSATTIPNFVASTRDSITSVDSLRSLQIAMHRKSSVSCISSRENSWSEGGKRPSDASASAASGGDQSREPAASTASSSTRRGSSLGNSTGSGRSGVASNPTLTQEQKQQLMFEEQQQILLQSAFAQQQAQQQDQRSASGPLSSLQQPQVTLPTSLHSGARNLSDIERQRAVNAQLQQQIADNIRRQEEMVRRLQESQTSSQQGVQIGVTCPASQGFQQVLSTQNSMSQNHAGSQFDSTFSSNNLLGTGVSQSQSLNNTSLQQQQQLLSIAQASNMMGGAMEYGNCNAMVQAFGAQQPHSMENALMEQNQLIQQQLLRPSLLGNSSNPDFAQQLLSLQAIQQASLAEESARRHSFASSSSAAASQPISNNNNFNAQDFFIQQGSSSNTRRNSSAMDTGGADTSGTPNSSENVDDTPLSPGSFRWL